MRGIPDGAARCCVTSPPYFGLRDYGVDGQIGLEATPDAFIAKMVEVFREVRRVLSDDGTLWLNLGDSYNSGSGGYDDKYDGGFVGRDDIKAKVLKGKARADAHLGPKQLIGIPWRVALALQADGWYLRSDIIWAKPNPMPESVRDRPTKAHEYVFLLSKQPRYFYDAEAVREAPSRPDLLGKTRNMRKNGGDVVLRGDTGREAIPYCNPAGRNARTVWTITPRPFKAWTQSSRLVPVAWGVLSGDTTHKASPDCPIHSSSDHRDSTRGCGGHGGDSSSRNGCSGGHHEPCTLPDCVGTGQPHEPSTLAQSSDSPRLTYSPTANGHNTQSHRTALDLSTTLPCTPCVETGIHTGCTEAQHGSTCRDHGTHESNTLSVGSTDDRMRRTPDCTADTQAAPDWIGASLESLRERGCTCTFYVTKTEKTSHFATFPPELAERCIKAGSAEGDTVLDPFAGAGTVGLVCQRLGRSHIGAELNPAYRDMAIARIKAESSPLLESVA
jgi:DNA modification methylase